MAATEARFAARRARSNVASGNPKRRGVNTKAIWWGLCLRALSDGSKNQGITDGVGHGRRTLELVLRMKPSTAISVLTWVALASAQVSAEIPPAVTPWLAPPNLAAGRRWPIISLGREGDFDDRHIFAPAVVEEEGRFWMWYPGTRGKPGETVFRLGLATSADGKAFEKFEHNSVFEMADGRRSVLTPCLLRSGDGAVVCEGGKLRMVRRGGLGLTFVDLWIQGVDTREMAADKPGQICLKPSG